MPPSPTGSVEELLDRIDRIAPSATVFDLWVPQNLTHSGEPVSLEAAMTVVLDQLLARGMFPDGFDQQIDGRTYHYRREATTKQRSWARNVGRKLFALLRTVGLGPKPRLSVGQVWSYATRPGEEESRVTVLRIEDEPSFGTIVHVAIHGIRMKCGGTKAVSRLSHIPVSNVAFQDSVLSVESELECLPDFAAGYHIWRTAFDAGTAGVFALPIAEIIEVMEATLQDGEGEWSFTESDPAG